jgi:putative PIN family toxin of toxin-antitoxin system
MNTPQVVIDTNVIVAGLRSNRGASFRLLGLVGTGPFDIHVSVPLVLEYEAVLLREAVKLAVSTQEIQALIDFHCAVAKRHQIFYLWRPFLPDADDDMILELAASSGCDSIITYNTRHFVDIERFGLTAIEPGPFLKRIGVLQ